METKRILMDGDAIRRAIRRIGHEILERNKGLSNAVIVGIERRGVMLAKRLQSEIEAIEGLHIECKPLNVAMYRCSLYRSYHSCCFKCIDDIWST